ncbi:hypothetical protein YSKK_21210 [Halopseudomonas aestusnigri]|nr:hypothetical protein YSKK_21210 [Halopseudomonas aestusnigri]
MSNNRTADIVSHGSGHRNYGIRFQKKTTHQPSLEQETKSLKSPRRIQGTRNRKMLRPDNFRVWPKKITQKKHKTTNIIGASNNHIASFFPEQKEKLDEENESPSS